MSSIKPSSLAAFPREVSERVTELVNGHGVRWRMQKGNGHLMLYPPDGTRPFKISASRMPERTLRYLDKWAADRGLN